MAPRFLAVENAHVLLSSLYFPLKKKKTPKLRLALRTSHSWADHKLTTFPPLTTQNSVRKGSPEFPEIQKHGAWEGIHSPALFPCRVEERRQLPGVGGREDGQAEAGLWTDRQPSPPVARKASAPIHTPSGSLHLMKCPFPGHAMDTELRIF